ncbi:MAG: Clp protease N-terminal domain-containing protein [Melioribacteraceae bacterium]
MNVKLVLEIMWVITMAFNFNKFTVKAQETVQSTIEIAQNYYNQIVEPEHLLAAMLQHTSIAESGRGARGKKYRS